MTSTRIAWPLRFWFFAELFFAVSASLSVGLRPALTAENFSWTIRPAVMAALFGAFYLSLAPVVVLLLFARRWEQVRVFVLPGMFFTAAQLAVTLLHWDRFAVGSGPFWIWFASYLLPPPVFLACYLWQQRRAGPMSSESPLARWQWRLAFALGCVFTLEALIGLIHPAWFTAWAPWTITPLNARALAGFYGLVGLMLLSIARENDRDRVRVVSPFLVLLLPVVAFQVSRYANEVDWTHPRVAVAIVALAAVALLGVSLMRGDWRKTFEPAG